MLTEDRHHETNIFQRATEMNDFKSLNELFSYIKTILELKKKAAPKNNSFTVFSVLGNETDEDKTHTTFLYEILKPNGLHGMGDVFIKTFFETVLNQSYSNSAQISKQHNIDSNNDNYGRIDLCIETSKNRYPIEIKIYAPDQDHQIDRYVKYAKEKSETSKVYYLTLDGHTPSSCDQSSEDDFICISFAEHISKWLTNCIDIARHDKNVVDVLNQYLTLLNKLTSSEQSDIYMDAIEKLISSSKDNYECAVAFEKGLVAVRTSKIKQIFDNIKAHLSDRIECNYDESELNMFYKEKNPYHALTGEIKTEGNIRLELAFEISVEGFYYGVAIDIPNVPQPEGNSIIQERKEFIKSLYNNADWKDWVDRIKGCWVWWKWLPSKNEKINFSNCSGENYLKLYDAVEFNKIMENIYDDIDSNLSFIIKNGVPKNSENLGHHK